MPNRRGSLTFYSLFTYTTGEVGVDVPIYSQFALGGANTVRGWELGERIGKNQFINTIEYWVVAFDYRQYEFWFLRMPLGLQTALFFDAGTAWTEGESFSGNWIAGGGIGVRLLIPSMVMVRFDLAYGQASVGVTIAIGSKEKAETQRDRVR
jgi:outer membrane protein assembly factor BamA